MLLNQILNIKRNDGIFLELGACDGIYLSNTKALEDNLEYSGILIEPSISHYNNLIKNRPKCKNYNCIVSNKVGLIDFIGDGTGVGGPLHILDKVKDNNNRTWIDAWKLDKNNIKQVLSKKLSDILHESNITYIDFWSLDVEGSELEVLETMDWNIPIYIICIEVTCWGENGKKNVEKCRNILRNQGFTSDGIRYGLDEWWINNNYFRKDLLFK